MSPSPVRPSLLRERSEQAVLEVVFREGPITRPEIAARTNLSKPTVSAVVDRLEKADLVHATGERPGRRGRKPMAYVGGDPRPESRWPTWSGTAPASWSASTSAGRTCARARPTSTAS